MSDYKNPRTLSEAEQALGLAYLVGEPDVINAALERYCALKRKATPRHANPKTLREAERALGVAYLNGDPDERQAALDRYWELERKASKQASRASDARIESMRDLAGQITAGPPVEKKGRPGGL